MKFEWKGLIGLAASGVSSVLDTWNRLGVGSISVAVALRILGTTAAGAWRLQVILNSSSQWRICSTKSCRDQ